MSTDKDFLRLVEESENKSRRQGASQSKGLARDNLQDVQQQLSLVRKTKRRLQWKRGIVEGLFITAAVGCAVQLSPLDTKNLVMILVLCLSLYLQLHYLEWVGDELKCDHDIQNLEEEYLRQADKAAFESIAQKHPPKSKNSFSILGIRFPRK